LTKTAAIIGGGPAGLTAALEFIRHTDYHPIVFEATDTIGGISRTEKAEVQDGTNRMDIGGHRFFSKSDEVMEWWNSILPVERTKLSESFLAAYPNDIEGVELDPDKTDDIMLVRNRLSRIYYGRKFYDYPVSLSATTIKNLGFAHMVKIAFSYFASRIHKHDETYLEGFYINRFGRELYNMFFRDYTEKLWGVPPAEIDASWGAQRVKGLSAMSVFVNAVKMIFKKNKEADLSQKDVETSLITAFLYPKLGPGHLWETVAKKIVEGGGEVRMQTPVSAVCVEDGRVVGVRTQAGETVEADVVFSTLPICDLVHEMKDGGADVPANVVEVADGLPYRDFITVGILADELKIKNETDIQTENGLVPDNWIYIQEPDVRVCRLQVFNNWSPYLVANRGKAWVGMEYVVSEKDDIWQLDDKAMSEFGISELEKIGIIDPAKVDDTKVIHMKKVYPAYFGTYPRFSEVRDYLDGFDNLFCIGRNGQHRYNNMDHSMLTAIRAVENVQNGTFDKESVWNVNTEQEYHESK
jgi:protoporphyrinogen oxidase